MQIIQPAVIDDAALTLTNVPEADYTEWSAASAYTVSQRVMRSVTGIHRNFECLANVGPTATTPENDPTKWQDLGATNRWAMFDDRNGTQTSNATSIVIELTHAQAINGVGLFNVSGSSVRVERIVSGYGTVYDKTVSLVDYSYIYDWWTYWFSPITSLKDVVFTDIPPYGAGVTRITISAPSGTAKCGTVVVGGVVSIGEAVLGSSYEYADFSVIKEDAFGVYTITKRDIAKRATLNAVIPESQVNAAYATLNSIASVPTVFIGYDKYQGMIIYGLSGRPRFSHPNHAMVELSLDIKGII